MVHIGVGGVVVWWKMVTGFFFPPFCLVCGGGTTCPAELICRECWSRAREREGAPFRITPEGGKLAANVAGEGIYGCCAHRWNKCLEKILHAFKYDDYSNLAEPLSRSVIDLLHRDRKLASCDLLLPVPLTRAKRRERGYNQAELLARRVARAGGLPVETTHLQRRGGSRSQTKLNRLERRKNVRGVFRLTDRSPFAGRHILIVDDVVTTGATAAELGRLLLDRGGAASVSVTAVVQAVGRCSS